mmetsp:Transcript_4300/g.6552  ORF Transcript_4300/g.6552 Transcript_4300/m.6552 type:complete len:214 (+) Transcript_4300:253-894(+)
MFTMRDDHQQTKHQHQMIVKSSGNNALPSGYSLPRSLRPQAMPNQTSPYQIPQQAHQIGNPHNTSRHEPQTLHAQQTQQQQQITTLNQNPIFRNMNNTTNTQTLSLRAQSQQRQLTKISTPSPPPTRKIPVAETLLTPRQPTLIPKLAMNNNKIPVNNTLSTPTVSSPQHKHWRFDMKNLMSDEDDTDISLNKDEDADLNFCFESCDGKEEKI